MVNMYCRNVLLDSQMPLWDKSAKMAHFAFFMQNCIYYFRWTAVLITVTKLFWEETIIVKYGSCVNCHSHKSLMATNFKGCAKKFSVLLAIWCLKISTFVLIKVLLTYLDLSHRTGC